MRTGIFAVLDTVKQSIIGNDPGGLMLHKHPASAIRMFTDALSDPQTILHKHPDDFDLVHLGYLEEDNTITVQPGPDNIVLSGKQWRISQAQPELPLPPVRQPVSRRERQVNGR